MLKKINKGVNKLSLRVKSLMVKNKLLVRATGAFTAIVAVFAKPAYAAPAVGQNGATYILEQVSWVILATAVGLAYKAFSKGNTARMVGVAVVGGIIFVLCKNPTKIQTFGNWVFEILGIQ